MKLSLIARQYLAKLRLARKCPSPIWEAHHLNEAMAIRAYAIRKLSLSPRSR